MAGRWWGEAPLSLRRGRWVQLRRFLIRIANFIGSHVNSHSWRPWHSSRFASSVRLTLMGLASRPGCTGFGRTHRWYRLPLADWIRASNPLVSTLSLDQVTMVLIWQYPLRNQLPHSPYKSNIFFFGGCSPAVRMVLLRMGRYILSPMRKAVSIQDIF